MIVVPILAFMSAIALGWSIFKYQTAYSELIELFPLEFQNPMISRIAFPEIALSPSTPLALQTDYMKSLIGSCFAALGFALFSIFFFEQAAARWLPSVAFSVMTASTIKSWKIYKENVNRRMARDDKETQ